MSDWLRGLACNLWGDPLSQHEANNIQRYLLDPLVRKNFPEKATLRCMLAFFIPSTDDSSTINQVKTTSSDNKLGGHEALEQRYSTGSQA